MTLPIGIDEPSSVITWRKPVATYSLIVMNSVIFFVLSTSYTALGFRSYDEVLQILGTYPADILYPGTLYRVFTAMFLHADILHLFGNMLFLFVFGRDIERVTGSTKFLLLYFLAGLIADVFNTLSVAILPQSALLSRAQAAVLPWTIPAVGASGAISGILGAYLILFPRTRLLTFFWFFPMLMTAELYIFIWFLYQLLLGLTFWGSTGIAFWAHIGGFIGGIALIPFFLDKEIVRYLRMRRRMVIWYYM
jgi:hypothetical protein